MAAGLSNQKVLEKAPYRNLPLALGWSEDSVRLFPSPLPLKDPGRTCAGSALCLPSGLNVPIGFMGDNQAVVYQDILVIPFVLLLETYALFVTSYWLTQGVFSSLNSSVSSVMFGQINGTFLWDLEILTVVCGEPFFPRSLLSVDHFHVCSFNLFFWIP